MDVFKEIMGIDPKLFTTAAIRIYSNTFIWCRRATCRRNGEENLERCWTISNLQMPDPNVMDSSDLRFGLRVITSLE